MYASGADIIFSAAGDVGLGVIEAAKEKGKFAIGVDRDQNDVAPDTVITSAMKKVNEGVDVVIGVGNTMKDDIKTEAENYPDKHFVIIDETYEDGVPENVTPILFRENEAAYLTGLVAGRMTETNKVGFIGGMEVPVIARFEYGYKAGVKEANPNVDVSVQYAGTFGDAAKGKSIANQMYSGGTDIILSAAGGTGLGAIESAKEQDKYAIGVDMDQSKLAPNNVLTSALKKVNVGVYDTVKEFVDGNLKGGEAKVYGLEQNGVGIPETTKNLVPQEILDYVNSQIEKVKSGDIKVPATKEEYGVGNTMKDDIKTEAENYPDKHFVIIDETYEDGVPENVTPILFRENEAAYLTGLVAGRMTETNKVGFIGGMEVPVIARFEYGYKAGVKEANPNVDVSVQYAGTFGDAAKGKSIANQMYSGGTDIILSAAGGTGLGAIESAKEQDKYAIGVDMDQSKLAPNNVLTSALKKVNVGVYDTVKEFVDGNLKGGEAKVYGLEQNGVGIPETTKNLVPQEILDYVNSQIEKVKSGDIKVPATKEEYNKTQK